jgi:hypothetical protein
MLFFCWKVKVVVSIGKYTTKLKYIISEKYYLVNSKYPNEYSFLYSYKDERYHLQKIFRRGQPWTQEEIFTSLDHVL